MNNTSRNIIIDPSYLDAINDHIDESAMTRRIVIDHMSFVDEDPTFVELVSARRPKGTQPPPVCDDYIDEHDAVTLNLTQCPF